MRSIAPAIRNSIRRWQISRGDEGFGRIKVQFVHAGVRAARQLAVLAGAHAYDDLKTEKIVSRKYRVVYIGINKVAHKSFRQALIELDSDAVIIRERTTTLLQNGLYKGYYIFSFVRNPWDRVVVCYLNKIANCRSLDPIGVISRYGGLRPHMPFDQFVEWLCSEEGADHRADRHWLSQHKFVTDEVGAPICNFIGKLENLPEDWTTVCRSIGLPAKPLPHIQRLVPGMASPASPHPGNGYRNYYTPRTRDMIAERYRTDLAMFGHTF